MSVGVGQVEFDSTLCLCPAATDLGERKFKTIRHDEPRPVLFLCYRIDDRLPASFHNIGNNKTRFARIQINVKVDLGEDWIMNFLKYRSIDLKECRAWFGVLPAHDPEDGGALRGVRAFIDNRDCLAVPLMDRARPGKHTSKLEPVELGVAMITLINYDSDDRFTLALSRKSVELTRAISLPRNSRTYQALRNGRWRTVMIPSRATERRWHSSPGAIDSAFPPFGRSDADAPTTANFSMGLRPSAPCSCRVVFF
jgi:hypothetical protein